MTAKIWNDPKRKNGSHVVVITGAELGRNGELLGYYINDTGTNDAGRFVTAKQFLDAWHAYAKNISTFIEVL